MYAPSTPPLEAREKAEAREKSLETRPLSSIGVQSSNAQRFRPIAGSRDLGKKRENRFRVARRLETRPPAVARGVSARSPKGSIRRLASLQPCYSTRFETRLLASPALAERLRDSLAHLDSAIRAKVVFVSSPPESERLAMCSGVVAVVREGRRSQTVASLQDIQNRSQHVRMSRA